jgi:hypothetical protein
MWLVGLLATIVLPLVILHEHQLSAIFAIWSLFFAVIAVRIAIGTHRMRAVYEPAQRRRLVTNTSVFAIGFGLAAVATFIGMRAMPIMMLVVNVLIAAVALYQFTRKTASPRAVDWLLLCSYMAVGAYLGYTVIKLHVFSFDVLLGSSVLMIALISTSKRTIFPTLHDPGLPARIRASIERGRAYDAEHQEERL